MPRIKTMMLVKMVLMMMLMTVTWCWEWCGQDGVDDDVDDKDLHDDDEGSTQPLGGKGQQGKEEHVRGRVRNELDKRVSHEPGQQEISLGPNLTFKSSTFQPLSVVPWCRWCCSAGRRRSAWCSPAPRHPVKITLKGIKHSWKPVWKHSSYGTLASPHTWQYDVSEKWWQKQIHTLE